MIGPIVEVRVVQFLGNDGLEFEITSPNRPERTSLVVMCRGKNRFVDDLHIPDPRNNPTSSELLSEQAIAKESEPCSTEMKQCIIEETRADSVNNLSDPVSFTKGILSMKEKKWKSIPAYPSFKGRPLSTAISKLVMRFVRFYDNTICPTLLRTFGDQGARESSENDGLQHIYEGSNKTKFE